MYLAFSAEDRDLSADFRQLLNDHPGRRLLEAADSCGLDEALWQALARDGWLGAALPEDQGGSGLGVAALCALCEQAGEALVAVALPQLFTIQRLLSRCDAGVVSAHLDASANGEFRPLLLLGDEDWQVLPAHARDGAGLDGETALLADGSQATALVFLIRGPQEANLVLLKATDASIHAADSPVLDVLHRPARWLVDDAASTVLATGSHAEALFSTAQLELAAFTAFEQVGGAAAALEAARRYALGRYAFGRSIASFQSIKHSLADVLAELELARSNAYFAAASFADERNLEEAACVARLSATEAYRIASRTSIQVHGALGVTWEADCHLHYRRAQALALSLGGLKPWRERLVDLLIYRRLENH